MASNLVSESSSSGAFRTLLARVQRKQFRKKAMSSGMLTQIQTEGDLEELWEHWVGKWGLVQMSLTPAAPSKVLCLLCMHFLIYQIKYLSEELLKSLSGAKTPRNPIAISESS